MKYLMILCLLFVAACTHVDKVPVSVPVETKIPVIIPCIDQHEVPVPPTYATQLIQGHESDCELVNIVLTERVQKDIYIEHLKAVLAGCVKPAGS